ncbi:Zn-dependent exopeptidase [Testicularia cyperi]|uniref:Peptide hydrolase n=1 Tax=Testicularia cyperi TaxID=1882483 RepID=A0A317XH02_9BASI|nr:Zn-dependent exopeptidase [Testicularia cyperi]
MKLTIPLAASGAILALAASAVPVHPGQQGQQLSLSLPAEMDAAMPTSQLASSMFGSLASAFRGAFEARLVQTAADSEPYWTTELGKQLLFYRGVNFMDVTDHQDLGMISSAAATAAASFGNGEVKKQTEFPKKLAHTDVLKKKVYPEISEKGPRAHLEKFTSFHTRYYKSATGRQSQAWLLSTVTSLVEEYKKFISVREFPHPWGQNSIILSVKGANSTLTKHRGVTILGAHQDSTNLFPFFAAPGADDDGSGTVTIIETLRVLLKSGWRPESDVEWHWYSAEEGGLLGSQAVAQSYERAATKVHAMLQQDMTAFVKAGTTETVGLVSDFVSTPLTTFIASLVDEYLDIGYTETKLGYAGSDHASWSKIGADSAFAIEATFENSNLKRIHTSQDTFDYPEFSFAHLMQFVRLSAAFVVELAGWAD